MPFLNDNVQRKIVICVQLTISYFRLLTRREYDEQDHIHINSNAI